MTRLFGVLFGGPLCADRCYNATRTCGIEQGGAFTLNGPHGFPRWSYFGIFDRFHSPTSFPQLL